MTINTHPQRNLAYYCQCFSQINVHTHDKKNEDKALNKPILLLSVIDAISQKIILDNKILISDELIEIFKKYWNLLTSKAYQSRHFPLPFFHLKNENHKFWHIQFSAEYTGGRALSIPKMKKDIEYAYLDQELFDLILDQNSKQELIDTLISVWFSSNKIELDKILTINQNFYNSTINETLVSSLQEQKTPKLYLRKSLVRDAFFRKAIVHIYDYKCAFCRLKVIHSINQSIVDGSHIKPFSEFYDNRINNGISLCKNHHWAFDNGLFTIDNNYKIIISRHFYEESPYNKAIRDFDGELILLPVSQTSYPDFEALKWHQDNIFKK